MRVDKTLDSMKIEQAINIVYEGLVGENYIPAQLRAYRRLDRKQLVIVNENLDFAISYYKNKKLTPKKLAIAMVDIAGAFFFKASDFEKEFLIELEDIGMNFQEKALKLFS